MLAEELKKSCSRFILQALMSELGLVCCNRFSAPTPSPERLGKATDSSCVGHWWAIYRELTANEDAGLMHCQAIHRDLWADVVRNPKDGSSMFQGREA